MKYEVIDMKNKVVKIECTASEYLNKELDKYIQCGLRQRANKIVIEMVDDRE